MWTQIVVVAVAVATSLAQQGDRSNWENTEVTTTLWQMCSTHNIAALRQLLTEYPGAVHLRSSDGRGPLFWAYEFHFDEAIDILESLGADVNAVDNKGVSVSDMAELYEADEEGEEEDDLYLSFFDDDEEDDDFFD